MCIQVYIYTPENLHARPYTQGHTYIHTQAHVISYMLLAILVAGKKKEYKNVTKIIENKSKRKMCRLNILPRRLHGFAISVPFRKLRGFY